MPYIMKDGIRNDLIQKLNIILNQAVKEEFAAGLGLLIIKDGTEITNNLAGYADKENKLPMLRDTIIRLYSMSKPITGAAAMLLMERGKLDLGEPVSKYIPGFKNQHAAMAGDIIPVKREVTIKDLLSMTSGLPYGDSPDMAGREAGLVFDELDRRLYSNKPMTTLELADRLGECSLSFQPGEGWKYGTGADVLGAVLEAASGMKFSEFLKKEIFDPLGMSDTGFYVPEDKQKRLAKVYEEACGSLKEVKTNYLGIMYQQLTPPAFESGGAGMVSTLPDYARFAAMLLNGGSLDDVRLLSPKTVQFFTSGELTPAQQETFLREAPHHTGYTYGNLMRVLKYPGMALVNSTTGEYGWSGWVGTYFANIPSAKLTVLLAMQKKDAGTTTLTRKLLNVIYSELLS